MRQQRRSFASMQPRHTVHPEHTLLRVLRSRYTVHPEHKKGWLISQPPSL